MSLDPGDGISPRMRRNIYAVRVANAAWAAQGPSFRTRYMMEEIDVDEPIILDFVDGDRLTMWELMDRLPPDLRLRVEHY
uniref:Uncharacterized protein n=1 Tax=Leviviridae sp. TaxID=2027243 RepID=A0A514D212_9VIRU|nr:MAG: hypothetical protein H2Bulk35999_000002 [Leviviridae sp.]